MGNLSHLCCCLLTFFYTIFEKKNLSMSSSLDLGQDQTSWVQLYPKADDKSLHKQGKS